MFKIFMCPSAVQLLLWRRHFVFSGLTKTASLHLPATTSCFCCIRPPGWHCLALALALSGHVLAMNRAGSRARVYFYLRQWQKVNENCREGEREREGGKKEVERATES